MDPNQVIDQAKTKLASAVAHFQEELKKIRTGRAHPSMLDSVMVQAYGSPMPLVQVATISVPEPQLLQISPFDPNNLQAIAAGIRDNQSLGLNPMDDGRVVRVQIPPLTEDRRKEFVKILNTKAEDCMVSMRTARHDALKAAELQKKQKNITEDDLSTIKQQLDDAIGKHKVEVDSLVQKKEQEILTV